MCSRGGASSAPAAPSWHSSSKSRATRRRRDAKHPSSPQAQRGRAVMTVATLPTRKSEAYRYTDLDALAGVWPVVREEIVVPAGGSDSRSVVELGESAVARHLVVTLA